MPKRLFQRHQAQTSPAPVGLHITRAEGNYLYDADGRRYLDLIGGISVCNVGHRHPKVVAAIKEQADAYLHVMVYGELVQTPPARYAEALCRHLPAQLDSVYFTNSGAEAVEGALKLARRVTGRTEVVSAINSYHGSTLGALSLLGDEYWRAAFRPLLPGIRRHPYNSAALLSAITTETACVVLETVQAEGGIIAPADGWLQAVRQRCDETGALLVLDEIQCGFGRTGTLWGFSQPGVTPDILLLGKALGGGLPLGAFISSYANMQTLTVNPVLGHITTFGGHPLSCAAGLAAFEALLDENMVDGVFGKEARFREKLVHPAIRAVRSRGLLMAVQLESSDAVMQTLSRCLERGLFSDWFLFAPDCIRLAPPLTITEAEIDEAAALLLDCLP
jgi:acetylornithine/N-succinyldiaminopimelate aminotransferase